MLDRGAVSDFHSSASRWKDARSHWPSRGPRSFSYETAPGRGKGIGRLLPLAEYTARQVTEAIPRRSRDERLRGGAPPDGRIVRSSPSASRSAGRRATAGTGAVRPVTGRVERKGGRDADSRDPPPFHLPGGGRWTDDERIKRPRARPRSHPGGPMIAVPSDPPARLPATGWVRSVRSRPVVVRSGRGGPR